MNRSKLHSILLTCTLLATLPLGPAHAQDGPIPFEESELFEDLAERWRGAVRDLRVPGCSIAVILDGEVYACSAYGVRNPQGDPVDGDTMFYIASVTKTYTAGALAKAAARGDVDLDAPVKDYLPRFELADPRATRETTVRDLLCHRPGINAGPIVFLDAYTGQITEDRFYHWLREVEPLGHVQYTNVHFTLAGRVLEAVTESSWKDALDAELFAPAGMTRTTAYASRMYADENVAVPMETGPSGTFVACTTRKSDATMHAAGGMGTTALDGARWLQLQIRDGEIDGEQVLKPGSVREMRTRQSEQDRDSGITRLTGFGLGWMLGSYHGHPFATHGGGYVGTAAHFSFLPEEGLGVVVLANGSPSGTILGEIVATDIYDRLLAVDSGHDRLQEALARLVNRQPEAAPPDNLTEGEALSLPIEAYVGTFSNPHWGDLALSVRDGKLQARIGALGLAMESTGTDRFTGRSSGSSDFDGRFLMEGSAVKAVSMDENGGMTFEREPR